MSRYEHTARAIADLQEIAAYTRERWGASQAERYGEELELAIQQLALTPGIGRERRGLMQGLRSFPVAQHIAFYVQRKDRITIVRVLHPSMDVDEMFEADG